MSALNNHSDFPSVQDSASIDSARECWSRLLQDQPFLFEEPGSSEDTLSSAIDLFSYLLSPIDVHQYYKEYYENKPLLVQRQTKPPRRHHFHGLFSQEDLQQIVANDALHADPVCYTRDLDITNYIDGKRITLNPKKPSSHENENENENDDENEDDDLLTDITGEFLRVDPDFVWTMHRRDGCSLRLKSIQTYSPRIRRMISLLEEFWGSGGGANVYLTPAGSQGFAPHYDDVEVFICQLEGAKHWKIYPNRTEREFLDRFSSKNFSKEELAGAPLFEATLRAGDFLALPRGTVHEARSVEGEHSLHITFSAGYRASVADFMQYALPLAVEAAAKTSLSLRRSVPMDLFDFAGLLPEKQRTTIIDLTSKQRSKHEKSNQKKQRQSSSSSSTSSSSSSSSSSSIHQKQQQMNVKYARFCAHVQSLTPLIFDAINVDDAADAMARTFIHGRLPHIQDEDSLSLEESPPEIGGSTLVRLRRRQAMRLVLEDSVHRLYYSSENSTRYLSKPAQFLEVDASTIPAIHALLQAYPDHLPVSLIPLENAALDDKIELVQVLHSYHLLAIIH